MPQVKLILLWICFNESHELSSTRQGYATNIQLKSLVNNRKMEIVKLDWKVNFQS